MAIVSEPRTGLGVGVGFDRHFFWRFFNSCASLIGISWLCSMGLATLREKRATLYFQQLDPRPSEVTVMSMWSLSGSKWTL